MGSHDLQACSPGGAVGVEEGRGGTQLAFVGGCLLCSDLFLKDYRRV